MLGALTMASFVVAVFFLRFWKSSGDRLFVFFSAAFAMLSVDWLALAFIDALAEPRHYIFVVRLLAFGLIIYGIVDKNRRAPPS
jgi:hypothetical protein